MVAGPTRQGSRCFRQQCQPPQGSGGEWQRGVYGEAEGPVAGGGTHIQPISSGLQGMTMVCPQLCPFTPLLIFVSRTAIATDQAM
jgi:hypothetical protein